jgi:hypothetical protein
MGPEATDRTLSPPIRATRDWRRHDGRVGQVSDVVDGVLFPESSLPITGEVLHIDASQIAGH